MTDHLAFLGICTGIDFNLVPSVFPRTSALPANTAKLEQIFANDRGQGIRDSSLQSLKWAADGAAVTVTMLEIYGDYDCGSGSLLKRT